MKDITLAVAHCSLESFFDIGATIFFLYDPFILTDVGFV